MDSVELLYIPKVAPISCQQIQRPCGYKARVIHMHDSHELCMVTTSARCQVFSGGNRWSFSGPAIIVHRAGSYHEMISVSDDSAPYDSRLVYFRTEGLPKAYLPDVLGNDCLIVPLATADVLLPYFDLLQNEQGQGQQLALLLLLRHIAQLDTRDAIRGDALDSYIFDVIKTIRCQLSDNLTISQLALRYHVSESKLKKDFSSLTGMPIKQFTTMLRLRHACNLLQNTDLDISAIAFQCGFSGESHFINTFRTNLGITPGKYKKARESYV